MSIVQAKENIIILLENIIKRSENIEKQKGSKSLLEIDLAMEDIRLLYREMDRLREFTAVADSQSGNYTEPASAVERAKSEVAEPQVPVEQPKTEQPPVAPTQPAPVPEAPVEREEKDEIPSPPAEEEKSTIIEETPLEQPKKESAPESVRISSEPAENKVPDVDPVLPNSQRKAPGQAKPVSDVLEKQNPVVGETFTNSKSSVHERLAQIKDDKSIGTRMQYKSVTSIKEAIGINEKFLFINELFSGDLNAYNDAVNQLNSCPSIHEAFELLNKLTIEFQWDGQRSAETIEKFANLVQRRYM